MKFRSAHRTSILTLCVAFAAYGCGSSPTGPNGPPPNGQELSIVFLDATGSLADKEQLIRQQIEQTVARAARDLPLDGLTIEVYPGRHAVPGWGVGGKAINDHKIELGVERDIPNDLIEDRLPSIVAHEVHHVARGRGPGYGNKLLQAMVSEGMADHYAQELFGRPLPPWVVVLSEEEIPVWIENARPEFDSKRYSHSVWFFGTGWVPRWTGYTVGFELIKRYKEAHPGQSAVSLVNADADLFRP